MRKFEDITFILFETNTQEEWDILEEKLVKKYNWLSDKKPIYINKSSCLSVCIEYNQTWSGYEKIFILDKENKAGIVYLQINPTEYEDDLGDYSMENLKNLTKKIILSENLGLL